MDERMLHELPIVEFAFPGPMRDAIIAAIESGRKTTTSSLAREYEIGDEQMPAVGNRGAVVDSVGARLFAIETTAVTIVRLDGVPIAHALAEGEGYESVADWRAGHEAFWRSEQMRAELGADFVLDGSSQVVLERFRRVG